MSTIAVDNARPSAGGTAYSLTDGVAKAWVNFNGTGTIAARDSYNVSGLTDNGTGQYTVSFTDVFNSTGFSFSALQGASSGGGFARLPDGGSLSASAIDVNTLENTGDSFSDADRIGVTTHGDLA